MPNFVHRNLTKVHQLSLENKSMQKSKFPSAGQITEALRGHDVFIYSGQKLNSAELQKKQMRKDYLAQQETKMWSYSPVYESGSGPKNGKVLERNEEVAVSRGSEVHPKFPKGARGRFRPGQSPPMLDGKERLPARDVGHARPDELHEQWQENEWRMWPGRERGKPLENGVEGVISPLTGNPVEDANQPWPRPFDPSKVFTGKTSTGVHVPNDPFGDPAMYTSPLNQITPLEVEQTMLQKTKGEQKSEFYGLKGPITGAQIHSGLLGTKDIHCWMTHRHVVQSTDKCETILKPDRKVADHKIE